MMGLDAFQGHLEPRRRRPCRGAVLSWGVLVEGTRAVKAVRALVEVCWASLFNERSRWETRSQSDYQGRVRGIMAKPSFAQG